VGFRVTCCACRRALPRARIRRMALCPLALQVSLLGAAIYQQLQAYEDIG
jgi:hypothetical protein